MGFTKSKADSNLYYKVEEGNPLILLLYVDDLFVTYEDGLVTYTKRKLASKFKMKDLGMMHYFIGMEVWQSTYGFFQKEGIDYEETFAPVFRYTSIRSVLSLATVMKWKIQQMDVKTAFLNGVVEEEVYVEQPLSFETHDRGNMCVN